MRNRSFFARGDKSRLLSHRARRHLLQLQQRSVHRLHSIVIPGTLRDSPDVLGIDPLRGRSRRWNALTGGFWSVNPDGVGGDRGEGRRALSVLDLARRIADRRRPATGLAGTADHASGGSGSLSLSACASANSVGRQRNPQIQKAILGGFVPCHRIRKTASAATRRR